MDASHLYIHVPFCSRRCVYCDFSIAVRSRVPVDEYLRALEREWRARHPASRFELDTLYLGGGTPSKLGPDGLRRLLDLVRSRASVRADAEVTLEANPEDVTPEAVAAWRDAGVNRLSLGVQTFDDNLLAWMHRTHDAATARRAIRTAQDGALVNVSIDLIFGTPSAIPRAWERDVDEAIASDVPHVSAYGLTVEPRTPLGRWVARHEVQEAPEDAFASAFMHAHDTLTAAGLEHYEVSNFGRHGRHSRHNWAYWRRVPYAGLGPSAHEFDGRERRWNVEEYSRWLALASRDSVTSADSEVLSESQVDAERVYLGMRTVDGLPVNPQEGQHVASWVAAGWATLDGDRLRLTPAGWLRLDALAADLTLFRSR